MCEKQMFVHLNKLVLQNKSIFRLSFILLRVERFVDVL